MPGSAFDSVAWGSGKATLLSATDSESWVVAENANATTHVQPASDTDSWIFGESAAAFSGTALQPTILGMTRQVGTLGGGTGASATYPCYIRGYNFTVDATVTIDGVACTVTPVSSTRIQITTPVGGSVGKKDVVVTQSGGTATLTAGFEYINASTITWAASSGWGSGVAPFTAIGGVVASATYPEPGGTLSALCTTSDAAGEASLSFILPANSATFLLANGYYKHYHMLMPTSVLSQLTGQIKGDLCRVANSGTGEWPHLGLGPQFASAPNPTAGFGCGIAFAGASAAQYGPGGHTGFLFRNSRWVEMLTWEHRTSGVSGRTRTWLGYNGGLWEVGDTTDAADGRDTTTDIYTQRLGVAFSQGNVAAANNMILAIGNYSLKDGLDT